MNLLTRPLVQSSLGRKYVMALTGFLLIGFVLAHMAGNLLIFVGRDMLNSYAAALKHSPALLWTARIGLLVVFLIHLLFSLHLTRENTAARPIPYVRDRAEVSSWASRHMLTTGMVLLAFIVYHLLHFTFGALTDVPDDKSTNYLDLKDPLINRHDVYAMVIYGFRNPLVTASYVLAQFFLWLHLWHGGSSWFQSLGINHPRYNWLLQGFGPVVATIVLVGNCAIPIAVTLSYSFNLSFLQP